VDAQPSFEELHIGFSSADIYKLGRQSFLLCSPQPRQARVVDERVLASQTEVEGIAVHLHLVAEVEGWNQSGIRGFVRRVGIDRPCGNSGSQHEIFGE
jgi:hypothetical protein